MGSLIQDLARLVTGIGADFSWLAWAYISILILLIGPLIVQVSPRVMRPTARLAATQKTRVTAWIVVSLLVTFGAIMLLFATFVAAPAAVFVLLWLLGASFFGYLALSQLVGQLIITRLGGEKSPPWLSALIGLLTFRLIRLIPIVGGLLHTGLTLYGYGAICALSWYLALAWHKRRMPDSKQFDGELLVEWYPDGDPEDGKPSTQTGRPVIDNVRGDEDDKQDTTN